MATFDSLFPALRELPDKPPRRELLPGLQRPPLPPGALLWLLLFGVGFTLVAAVMFATIKEQKTVYSGKSKAQMVLHEPITAPPNSTGLPTIFLKYRFHVHGREVVSAYVTDSRDPLFKVPPGERFDVVYNPSNPDENRSASNSFGDSSELPLVVWVMMPLLIAFWFGLIFVPVLTPRLKVWWLARRLFKRGLLAQGHIVFVHEGFSNPYSQGSHLRVVYAFTDASGARHERVQVVNNSWLVGQWKVEAPVVVAYDVKKPRQSVILDGFLVAQR